MAIQITQKKVSRLALRSLVPILGWLPNYNRAWLRGDIIAGLTVVALLVPEGMAYAELAGMPPQAAFYAAPAGLLLYAIFGSSRQLVVAVSSAVAVMSASIIGDLVPAGTEEFYAMTSALALIAGAVAVLAGLLRLGRIAQFFSESVLTGFVSGLALVIIIKQVPKIFGLEAAEGNFWQRLYDLVMHIDETHILTLAVGVTTLLLMLFLERYFHRVPAALVALLYGILVVTIFDLDAQGVHIVGEIPAGLAPPKLPDVSLSQILTLVPGALGISLVMFAEAIGPARSFASKHRYRIDDDQELIGLGAANLGAGLFQGFSIGASLSKSAANDDAGAKSQMSGIIAAGLTLLVALFLTPLFYNLPEATLGAIVVVAVAGMFKIKDLRWLYRVRRQDFWLAMVALLGVLTFKEVLAGLLVAVIVSLLALVARTSQSKFSILGREPGHLSFSDVRRHPENIQLPGLLILRPDEEIFFANASTMRETLRAQVEASQQAIQTVLLDLEMTNELDAPSTRVLIEMYEEIEVLQIRLILSAAHAPVRDMLDRSGATDIIGEQNIHPALLEGVYDHLESMGEAHQFILEVMSDLVGRLQSSADTISHSIGEAEKAELLEQIAKQARQIQEDINQLIDS